MKKLASAATVVAAMLLLAGCASPGVDPDLPPVERLEATIFDKLGEPNRDAADSPIPRFTYDETAGWLQVAYPLSDNLNRDLILVGAQTDIVDILEIVRTAAEEDDLPFNDIEIIGTFGLRDQLGNVEEGKVLQAKYDYETVSRINFENFQHPDVDDIATEFWLHQAMR